MALEILLQRWPQGEEKETELTTIHIEDGRQVFELTTEISFILNWTDHEARILDGARPIDLDDITVVEEGRPTDLFHINPDGSWFHFDYIAGTKIKVDPVPTDGPHPDDLFAELNSTPRYRVEYSIEIEDVAENLTELDLDSALEFDPEVEAQIEDVSEFSQEFITPDGTFSDIENAKEVFLRLVKIAGLVGTVELLVELSGPSDPNGLRVERVGELGPRPWQALAAVTLAENGQVEISGDAVTPQEVFDARQGDTGLQAG